MHINTAYNDHVALWNRIVIWIYIHMMAVNDDFFLVKKLLLLLLLIYSFPFVVNFDHFQILRAIGKGSFGKVRRPIHIHHPCLYVP